MRLAPAIVTLVVLLGCEKESGAPPATTGATPPTSPTTAAPESPAPSAPASTASAEVTVGSPPPDFSATATDGTSIHLAALKGKAVVVYFYPKDETPGCTKEACSFRDAWDGLARRGVVLIGVSADTDDSHRAFAAHHKLPFLLVSDTDGKLANLFGVPFHDGYESRQSFVIGPDGLVRRVYRKVDVVVHAQEITADVQ